MKHLLLLIIVPLVAHVNLSAQGTVSFVRTWKTTTMNVEITIPIQPGLTYNDDINWGDGSIQTDLTKSDIYQNASPAPYEFSITRDLPAIYINTGVDKEPKFACSSSW